MANITVKGNVGDVRLGNHQKTQFLSFSVAENHGYFDKQSGKWIDKGTLWHNCTMSFTNNNDRFKHYCEIITKGVPVLVSGRLSINPSESQNNNGEIIKYNNEYIQVESVGITIDRVQTVIYKPKQELANIDPELQQSAQTTQSGYEQASQPAQQHRNDSNPAPVVNNHAQGNKSAPGNDFPKNDSPF